MSKTFFRLNSFVCFWLALLIVSCQNNDSNKASLKSTERDPSLDYHSFSNPEEVAVKHMVLNLDVNFDQKIIAGEAILELDKIKSDTLKLDCKGLEILWVKADTGQNTLTIARGQKDTLLGEALLIPVKKNNKKIIISYRTKAESEALQWLNPSQTGTKKYPFLYTQSEANLARTWFPCQDSPGARFTYEANITVPSDLMAVMSATNETKRNASGKYHCTMEKAVPAYLVALAVGRLEFLPLGPRTGVYAEPNMVRKAAVEFSDVEKMIAVSERLYGPYAWGRYDVIVLPPSFPFGGMENPRLTFLTPTIIAGDKSLTSVLAHELAHSWSGNLVTNKTWNDFWLNEGFTVYFERRIVEEIYGKDYMEMQAVIGRTDLSETMADLGEKSEDTRLKLDLFGRNPDDGMNDVAYEKGYLFLKRVEEVCGRTKMDIFLKNYFKQYAFSSMTTEKFEKIIEKELLNNHNGFKNKINLKEWLYEPGLPVDCPKTHSERYDAVDSKVREFLSGTKAANLSLQLLETWEWLRFLDELPDSLPQQKLLDLDESYELSNSGNAEILDKWLRLGIRSSYQPCYESLNYFVLHVGRRKFIRPLFQDMLKSSLKKEMALDLYKQARPHYHSLLVHTLDDMFSEAGIKVQE